MASSVNVVSATCTDVGVRQRLGRHGNRGQRKKTLTSACPGAKHELQSTMALHSSSSMHCTLTMLSSDVLCLSLLISALLCGGRALRASAPAPCSFLRFEEDLALACARVEWKCVLSPTCLPIIVRLRLSARLRCNRGLRFHNRLRLGAR